MQYAVMPFVALGWDASLAAWGAYRWAGHAIALGLIVLLAPVPAVRAARGGKAAEKQAPEAKGVAAKAAASKSD